MYLPGTLVASWSLSEEVAGLNPFNVMTNIFVTEFIEVSEFAEFSESIQGKLS